VPDARSYTARKEFNAQHSEDVLGLGREQRWSITGEAVSSRKFHGIPPLTNNLVLKGRRKILSESQAMLTAGEIVEREMRRTGGTAAQRVHI